MDFNNMNFMGNHNHTDEGSNLRMLDCTNKIKPLIDRAIELGYKGLSITDHSSVSVHIKAIQYVKELKEKGQDFILGLGSEEYLVDDIEDTVNNYQGGVTKFWHFIFIAKDKIGYEQLRRIDSTAWDNSFMTGKMRRTPIDKKQVEEIIGDDKGHLLVQTACLGSQLAHFVLNYLENQTNENKQRIHEFITWIINTFGKENVALEIQPSRQEDQIKYNKFLIMLSEAYELKIIITNDTHYLRKEDRPVHEAFIKSRDAIDREVGEFYATTYLMSIEEMWDYTKDYIDENKFKEIINNSYEFTKDIEFIDMQHTTIIPERDLSNEVFEVKHIFKDWYDECKGIKDFAYSPYIQDKYLLYMVEVGFLEKKEEFNETNIKRIDWELTELWKVSEALNDRMSAYYNLVDYIVDLCWTIGFVGISRGSVTGYYTMYLIDIHQMNPIKWNLPAYRHLNSSRVSFPDVDLDTSAKNRPKIIQKLKDVFGVDNILNICTFKTETAKSAVKTACRGLGISNDEADYLASLIVSERGKLWTIHDCLYGNKEKNRKPNKDFVFEIESLSNKYNVNLQYTIEMIEGLVSGLSSHASGIYIFKNGYIKQNSKMKTPRGDSVTAWEMSDSDYCGGLKYDSLTTECQDKLEVCLLNYLPKYNKIENQGTIRATYNKYLHPDVLNYDNQQMWDECSNGQIIDLFQFITPVGGACIRKVKPHNLEEMASANSLMRISVKDEEQPIDKFLRYKKNISLWYDELKKYGITKENEIKALEKVLLPCYGVCSTQEDIMELSMDENISNFTLVDADKMRKTVAKKRDEDVAELKKKFFNHVKDNGNSENIANYVWEQCIKPQLAYSFSRNHVKPYSAEALQEMNLYHFYPNVYWNCSALAVNAGVSDELEDINTEDEEVYLDDDDKKKKGTKYGKIAKAIYRSINFGVNVLPPNINKSDISFTPIEETNEILFGLGGIAKVNSEISKQIIDNRPYANFKDFYDKNCYKGSPITKTVVINLIKSGAFTETDPNIINTMKWLCVYENPAKESLTASNLDKAIEYKVNLPQDLVRAYRFKKYVINKNFFYCNDPKFKSKKHYIVEPNFARPYFEKKYIDLLEEEKDYYYDNDNLIVIDKSLEKAMKQEMDTLKEILKNKNIVDEYNKKMWNKEYIDMVKKEDINKWSFDSISFYANGKHELDGVNLQDYNISHFSDLPEEPQFIEKSYGKRKWKQYDISRICGTVLDRNDNNHLVDILTPDNEVVTLNIPQAQYGYYKQTITIGEEKDENYLKRGNIILVSGYRRNDAFFVKNYKNSVFQHSVVLVKNITEDKKLELQLERLDKKYES